MDAYLADYQKRLAHDQQFPDEPKQVLEGESVSDSSASGQVSVMLVNDRLVEMLLQNRFWLPLKAPGRLQGHKEGTKPVFSRN